MLNWGNWFLITCLVGCTQPNPTATCNDGRCVDPAFPYCDLNGIVGGTPDECIAVSCDPGSIFGCDGTSVLTCNSTGTMYDEASCDFGCDSSTGCKLACSPNTPISCADSTYVACNADGTGTVSGGCALGCSIQSVCLTFDPSNGLGAATDDSAARPPVILGTGTHIDTDSGNVIDSGGTVVTAFSTTLNQVGGPTIRIFAASSFEIHDVTITGTNAVAFVSVGEVQIVGVVRARATGSIAGPGTARPPTGCVAIDNSEYQAGCGPAAVGAGGGGNATVGGIGGGTTGTAGNPGAPGTVLTSFSPLSGGCSGGSQKDLSNNLFASGGAGGGAIQIVSRTKISLLGSGLIDVGGGGGQLTTGGGSGGNIVLEAPAVVLGPSAGITANGGAGGGCDLTGSDGLETLMAALAPSCSYFFGGNGGTASSTPGNACIALGAPCASGSCAPKFGGGGGAAGRVRIATGIDGYMNQGGLISAAIVSTTLNVH